MRARRPSKLQQYRYQNDWTLPHIGYEPHRVVYAKWMAPQNHSYRIPAATQGPDILIQCRKWNSTEQTAYL